VIANGRPVESIFEKVESLFRAGHDADMYAIVAIVVSFADYFTRISTAYFKK
jgi:hypothetical protein